MGAAQSKIRGAGQIDIVTKIMDLHAVFIKDPDLTVLGVQGQNLPMLLVNIELVPHGPDRALKVGKVVLVGNLQPCRMADGEQQHQYTGYKASPKGMETVADFHITIKKQGPCQF